MQHHAQLAPARSFEDSAQDIALDATTAFANFVTESLEYSAALWRQGLTAPIFDRRTLARSVEDDGLKQLDLDCYEIEALLQVRASLYLAADPGHSRYLCVAAARRLHEILEGQPELAHRRRAGDDGQTASLDRNVLFAAMNCGLPLSPKRLALMAEHPAVRAAVSEIACSGSAEAPFGPRGPLANPPDGVMASRGLAALVRAGVPFPPSRTMVLNLARTVGYAAIQEGHVFNDALVLVAEIGRQLARHQQVLHWRTPTAQDLEHGRMAQASAQQIHPVLAAVHQAFIFSAHTHRHRRPVMDGFPHVPLARAANALNSLLQPQDRLALQDLDAVHLLEITALCATSNQTESTRIFFTRLTPAFPHPNSADMLLQWAATHESNPAAPEKRSGLLARFERIRDQLAAAVGADRSAAVEALLRERLLRARIEASRAAALAHAAQISSGAAATTNPCLPTAPARRRCKAI
jgi:hypothetical protein